MITWKKKKDFRYLICAHRHDFHSSPKYHFSWVALLVWSYGGGLLTFINFKLPCWEASRSHCSSFGWYYAQGWKKICGFMGFLAILREVFGLRDVEDYSQAYKRTLWGFTGFYYFCGFLMEFLVKNLQNYQICCISITLLTWWDLTSFYIFHSISETCFLEEKK